MHRPPAGGGAMLTLGEVHTGFLRNSTSVSPVRSARVLAIVEGERVRHSARPLPYAVSPDILRGVDCRLVAASGARHRTIGTVVTRAAITGGHVLQGSAFTRVVSSGTDRRLSWPHYLTRPGVVETLGKVDWGDLADGFLSEAYPPESLDLSAICTEVMHQVQASSDLDQKAPLRTGRTHLRWAALDGDEPILFAIEERGLRTLRLPAGTRDASAIAEVCADLALHDWLLSCLQSLIEASDIGAVERAQVVRRFGPAIDHLLHLWMPAARVDRAVWEALERRPGMTRQWVASVNRIRDQVAAGTMAMLSESVAGTRHS
ncbi:SCO2521 family protein [Phytohabitans kaempferiae]|uniref:SCO2521 family protein n=1 Tax=Phytohabitans kaempferiae TaxID=1620943 RepID=A0ABV6M7N3_9ACTN